MEIKRIKRYRDKIKVIAERSEEISEWMEGYEAEEFTRDEKIVPKDDYTNIENLNFIDKNIKGVLIEANGLRNRLVHRYNQSDDLVAFVSIKELLPRIEEFVEMIEQWMRK